MIQEAITEILKIEGVFTSEEIDKRPYACDMLLLELLDGIWVNEVFLPKVEHILESFKTEISHVHKI